MAYMDDPITAEQAAETPAEREALDVVRDATGETGGAMERHNLRVFRIACELAARKEIAVDREVLLVAAFIHDLGLYDKVSRGGVYVKDGADFATELLERQGWEPKRIRLCADAIERHHELRPQWKAGDEVELLRRADLVDISSGLVTFGLSRSWLRSLFAEISRDGAYREVGRLVGHALRERPLSMARIFLR